MVQKSSDVIVTPCIFFKLFVRVQRRWQIFLYKWNKKILSNLPLLDTCFTRFSSLRDDFTKFFDKSLIRFARFIWKVGFDIQIINFWKVPHFIWLLFHVSYFIQDVINLEQGKSWDLRNFLTLTMKRIHDPLLSH